LRVALDRRAKVEVSMRMCTRVGSTWITVALT
jgi:hypothetical protein